MIRSQHGHARPLYAFDPELLESFVYHEIVRSLVLAPAQDDVFQHVSAKHNESVFNVLSPDGIWFSSKQPVERDGIEPAKDGSAYGNWVLLEDLAGIS